MGSINYGKYANARAVEKAAFAERLKSQAEVEKNGGVVGSGVSFTNEKAVFDGTANAKIVYNTPFRSQDAATFIIKGLKFYSNATGNAGLIVKSTAPASYSLILFGNALYTRNAAGGGVGAKAFTPVIGQSYDIALTVTSAGTGQFYVDGVALGTSFATGGINFNEDTIGYTSLTYSFALDGEIDDVLFFREAKTPAEILAYSNNTMWNYDQNCELALPMLLRDHDATAGTTKDRSGNGNDAVFGDGSTSSTFPTFDTKIGGYLFSSTNKQYLDAGGIDVSNWEGITLLAFIRKSDTKLQGIINKGIAFSSAALLDIGFGIWNDDRLELGISNGVSVLTRFSTSVVQNGDRMIGVSWDGSTDSDAINFIIDGKITDKETSTTALSSVPNVQNFFIADKTYDYRGYVISAFIFKTALNPTQIRDLYQRMLINKGEGRRGL